MDARFGKNCFVPNVPSIVIALFFLGCLGLVSCDKSNLTVLPVYYTFINLTGPSETELTGIPTLEWTASGMINGFQVMISDSSKQLASNDNSTVVGEIITTAGEIEDEAFSFVPGTDVNLSGEEYFWKVRAYNEFRYYYSESRRFFTNDITEPTITESNLGWDASTCSPATIPHQSYTFGGLIQENFSIAETAIYINDTNVGSLTLTQDETDPTQYTWSFVYDFYPLNMGTHDVLIEVTDSSQNKGELRCQVVIEEFYDTFSDSTISDRWNIVHTDGDGSVVEISNVMKINNGSQGGDFFGTENSGSIVYYELPNENFEATVHVNALTAFNFSAVFGIFCDATDLDTENYIIQSDCCGVPTGYESWGIISRYSDGSVPDWDDAATPITLKNNFYLKIARYNNKYGFFYSTDGSTFQQFNGSVQNITCNCTGGMKHLGLLSGASSVVNVQVLFNSVHITTSISSSIQTMMGG